MARGLLDIFVTNTAREWLMRLGPPSESVEVPLMSQCQGVAPKLVCAKHYHSMAVLITR